MKIFRQAIIILAVYFLGEIISKGLSLAIPGNILGMILLFVLLASGVLKLEKIETVANFFLDHLAFFFIPAGIGLMTSFAQISSNAVSIILICIITTVIVMATTGLIVQFIANKSKKQVLDRNKSNKNRRE